MAFRPYLAPGGFRVNHGSESSTYDLQPTKRATIGPSLSLLSPPYLSYDTNHHSVGLGLRQNTEDYLRHQLNIPPYQDVNLSLPDPVVGQPPSQPLPVLIKLAIHGSPNKMLTFREICLALEERFV